VLGASTEEDSWAAQDVLVGDAVCRPADAACGGVTVFVLGDGG